MTQLVSCGQVIPGNKWIETIKLNCSLVPLLLFLLILVLKFTILFFSCGWKVDEKSFGKHKNDRFV